MKLQLLSLGLTSVRLLLIQLIAGATPLQDNVYLSVVQAGKAMFLRESGFITKELIPNTHLKVSFKEPVSAVISVQMLDTCLALVTKENNGVKVSFYSKTPPAKELSSSKVPLSGKHVFCFGSGDQLILSDAKKVVKIGPRDRQEMTFEMAPRVTMRSVPSCAMNHRCLAFGFNRGEWGDLVTAVNVDTQEERLIWESKTENLIGSIIDGGTDGFYAMHEHHILNWRENEPIKNYSVAQEIVSMYPLEGNKILALAPNGDIFDTTIKELAQSAKAPRIRIAESDLRKIVYCDGIRLIGVNFKGELVTLDMKGGGEHAFALAGYQLKNLLEAY